MNIAFVVSRAPKLKLNCISGSLRLAALSVFVLGMVPNLFARPDLIIDSNRATTCTWCNNVRFAHNISFSEGSFGVFEPEGSFHYSVGTDLSSSKSIFDALHASSFAFTVGDPITLDRFAVALRPVMSTGIFERREGPGGELSPPRPFDPLHMLRELRLLVVGLMESNLSLSLVGFHP